MMAAVKQGKKALPTTPGEPTTDASQGDCGPSSVQKTDDPLTPPAPQAPQRRKSTFKGLAANFLTMRRTTKASTDKEALAAAIAASAAAKPTIRLENTYQLGPKENQRFNFSQCQKAIQAVLSSALKNETYQPDKASTFVAMLSERVKAAVKSIPPRSRCERHKLVTSVALGPVSDQGMTVVSRCLWDPATDTSSTVTFNNGEIYAVVNVFAVYYE